MREVITGDFGTSFWTNEPISALIARRGPISAQIAIMAVLFSWLIGVPVGMLSAMWRNSVLDYASRLTVTLFIAMPSYWIGLLIVLFTVLIFIAANVAGENSNPRFSASSPQPLGLLLQLLHRLVRAFLDLGVHGNPHMNVVFP